MSKPRVLFVLDTPAEAVELAPLIERCRQGNRLEAVVCATNADAVLGGPGGDSPAVRVDVSLNATMTCQTPADLVGRCIEQIDAVIVGRRPDAVVVVGDTAVAAAAVLAAAYRRVPVAQFAALPEGTGFGGLSPEQLSRRIVARLSTLHFTLAGQTVPPSAEAFEETLLEALSPRAEGNGDRDAGIGIRDSGFGDRDAGGRPLADSRDTTCRRTDAGNLAPDPLLSVVIPVYNERDTLEEILRRVRAVPIRKEIILIDDASTDGTRDLLAGLAGQSDLRILHHERNQGKGAALRTGFAYARGDIVVIQDADLEYSPSQYPRLIEPIVRGEADVVYGSRFASGGPRRVLRFWHSTANRLLTTVSNAFTNLNLTDMETCHKVFRREVIEAIRPTLKQNRFGIEPELTAKIARRKYRVFEIGIPYAGRTYSQGKKIGLVDAFEALWCTVRYWLAD